MIDTKETNSKLNILMKISIVLYFLPIFMGGFLKANLGLNNIVFLVLIMTPFYFVSVNLLIDNTKKFINIKYSRYYIFYIFYCFFSLFYSLDIPRGISSIVLLILPIIIGFLFSRFNVLEIHKYIAWSVLGFSVLLYLGLPTIFLDYESISNRFAYYYGDIEMNPNSFSILLNFILIYFLFRLITTKNRFIILINLICIIVSLFLLIETQSRSGIYTFLIIFLLTFLLKVNLNNIIFGSFVVAIISFVVLLNINLDFESRVFEADLNERDNYWKVGLNESSDNMNNLLFGYGMASSELIIGGNPNVYSIVDENGYHRANPHNMYLENLLNLGIFGIVIFLMFFFNLVLYLFRNFKFNKDYLPLMITLILLISGMLGNQMRSYYFVIIFSLVVGYSIQKTKEWKLR